MMQVISLTFHLLILNHDLIVRHNVTKRKIEVSEARIGHLHKRKRLECKSSENIREKKIEKMEHALEEITNLRDQLVARADQLGMGF